MARTHVRRILPQNERTTLSIEEAAKVLGIGRTLAYAAAKNGQIPALQIGGRTLIPKAALQKMLEGDWTPPDPSVRANGRLD